MIYFGFDLSGWRSKEIGIAISLLEFPTELKAMTY
jgi:hypothetical protein